MTFKEAINLSERIITRFEKIEQREWGVEGAVIELAKQLGELSKLVMVCEKYYFANRDKVDKKYDSSKEKIGDELADIIYATVRIARHYRINLEDAYIQARKTEDDFLRSKGV